MPDLPARLARLGLTQAELVRWIEGTTGERPARSTLWRQRRNPWRDALLAVIEDPTLIEDLKR